MCLSFPFSLFNCNLYLTYLFNLNLFQLINSYLFNSSSLSQKILLKQEQLSLFDDVSVLQKSQVCTLSTYLLANFESEELKKYTDASKSLPEKYRCPSDVESGNLKLLVFENLIGNFLSFGEV